MLLPYQPMVLLSFAAVHAQLLYAAPRHLVWTNTADQQYLKMRRLLVVLLQIPQAPVHLEVILRRHPRLDPRHLPEHRTDRRKSSKTT
jgi:hypothetical protein